MYLLYLTHWLAAGHVHDRGRADAVGEPGQEERQVRVT
jgi:hypothetical protein